MKDLPRFKAHKYADVVQLMKAVFTHQNEPEHTYFVQLITEEDGHYRAVFRLSYFSTQTPSKSQWNSLKKKLKRHHPAIFVFKDYGTLPCQGDADTCGYLDFGFFADG